LAYYSKLPLAVTFFFIVDFFIFKLFDIFCHGKKYQILILRREINFNLRCIKKKERLPSMLFTKNNFSLGDRFQ